jgi:hypothetical protein
MEAQQTEQQESLLDSPMSLLLRVRNFLFGEEKPDGYTQVTFYINLVLCAIFFFGVALVILLFRLEQLLKNKNRFL